MKKTLSLCLFVVILLSSVAAVASDMDLSALSYDELVDLKIKVTTEVMSRPETKSVSVPIGIYEIGVHIPAGEYSLKLDDGHFANITISISDDFSDYRNRIDSTMVDEKGVGRMILKDGQFVQVEHGSIFFSAFTGLGF